jgi:hypothetical protein
MNVQDVIGVDGVSVASCTIVPLAANKLMAEIHDAKRRTPAILAREDRDVRLTGTSDEPFGLPGPLTSIALGGRLQKWPPSARRVSRSALNGRININTINILYTQSALS